MVRNFLRTFTENMEMVEFRRGNHSTGQKFKVRNFREFLDTIAFPIRHGKFPEMQTSIFCPKVSVQHLLCFALHCVSARSVPFRFASFPLKGESASHCIPFRMQLVNIHFQK